MACAQAGPCAQPYATAQSVCHLPIEQLMKKIRNGETEWPMFFSGAVLSKIKPSPNCLRILIFVNHREIRVPRIAREFRFSIGAHRNR